MTALTDLAKEHRSGNPHGIVSVCSAHPLVLRAAVQHAKDTEATLLIEATCNQVNHQGGYTGLTPMDFAGQVAAIMADEACPPDRVILGGDHLGPNPWRHLAAAEAMQNACDMVEAYVAAGFRKIHLDASMGCASEPQALNDTVTAARAAKLADHAERAAARANLPPPYYVIGTEVPPPGGADHVLDTVKPTQPEAGKQTLTIHRTVFEAAGLKTAFSRVIALVVQPGVEFGNENVVFYDPKAARGLSSSVWDMPDIVFEAHSTDYQSETALTQLVRDGYAVLKVGPELTFAMREALYALDLIASEVSPSYGARPLFQTMEQEMLSDPQHWERHCNGTQTEVRLMRHYSLSDRIRYYWNTPKALQAVDQLFDTLDGSAIPAPVLQQFLSGRDTSSPQAFDPKHEVINRIRQVLRRYSAAATRETPT
ncbi:MAG: D-tagatose-bisphosphate aldolase, class II, non-catalytic subunit [Pseudomonadota bacterium]